jgi:solute carrier family 35 protein E1
MMTKSLLTKAYYPWTIATIQMMSGAVCQLPLWYFGKRMIPKLDKSDIKSLFPIALCQFGIHAGATIATGITKGLALAHIIKALEPMCTMGVDHILAMRDIPVERFLGIIPLVAGSILPFWKHVSFDWLSMVAALIVVASSSTRVVLCRRILSDSKEGTNLDPSNLFAILSVMTSALFVPLAFCFDGLGFVGALTEISQFESIAGLLGRLCMSGFLYYMFHVASFDLMTKVTPVTHAVANLMRRPAVMLLFAFLDTVQQLARNIPVKWLPLSFLFWSKAVQDTHSVADIFRGTLFASLTAYVAPPSLDSFVSSLLALGGCLIYAKEVNGSLEDILFPKKAGHGERKKKQSNLGIAQ